MCLWEVLWPPLINCPLMNRAVVLMNYKKKYLSGGLL